MSADFAKHHGTALSFVLTKSHQFANNPDNTENTQQNRHVYQYQMGKRDSKHK